MIKGIKEYLAKWERERRAKTIARCMPTLRAFLFDGGKYADQYRAADRIFIDGGDPSHIPALVKLGLVEIRDRPGYVLIGAPHVMVRITAAGVAAAQEKPQ